MPVVVDLPLVPATPIEIGAALNISASSSARVISRAPARRAACTSGTLSSTAAEVTRIWSAPGQARAVLREEGHAAGAQEVELLRRAALVERAVGALDLVALGLDDQGQGQHAAAADAAEEIGFSRGHLAVLIGQRQGATTRPQMGDNPRANRRQTGDDSRHGSDRVFEAWASAPIGSAWWRPAAVSPRKYRRKSPPSWKLHMAELPPEIVFHPQCFEICGHFAGDDEHAKRPSSKSPTTRPSTPSGSPAAATAPAASPSRRWPRLTGAARGKAYLGYSDGGFLLAGLYRAGFPRVAHGPMPCDIARAGRRGGGAPGARLADRSDPTRWSLRSSPA